MRIDDGHLSELEVPFDEWHCPSSNRAMPYHTHIVNASINFKVAHLLQLLYSVGTFSMLYSPKLHLS